MIALLLAAQLAAAPPVDVPRFKAFRRITAPVCKGEGMLHTSGPSPALLLRPQDKAKRLSYRLNELPKANHEKAVLRIGPDGCEKPVVVQFNVGP